MSCDIPSARTIQVINLGHLLRHHDWNWVKSRRYEVFLKGQKSYHNLVVAARRCPDQHNARAVWAKEAPEGFLYPL